MPLPLHAVNVSAIAKQWNEFRCEIVREALLGSLLPQMLLEARQKLTADAKDEAMFKCVGAKP